MASSAAACSAAAFSNAATFAFLALLPCHMWVYIVEARWDHLKG